MGKKAKVGDIFLIPIDAVRYGIGQLAGDWKGELYLVVYDKIVAADATPADIEGAALQFAALSLDAKLYNGDWSIIGNRRDNIAHLPQPLFKVGHEGQTFLESRDRSIFRRASASEADQLRLRTVVAPIRLEKALKARNGIGDWHAHYDQLLSGYAIKTAELVQR